MTVYLVTFTTTDGDCEGVHLVGIFTTQAMADTAVAEHQAEWVSVKTYDYTVLPVILDYR